MMNQAVAILRNIAGVNATKQKGILANSLTFICLGVARLKHFLFWRQMSWNTF